MKLLLIRHGATKGNIEKRYVGRTDEGLIKEAVSDLENLKKENQELFDKVSELYVSPMKRCEETADVLLPRLIKQPIEDFLECDFGEFEYKNYDMLNGNVDYQSYIDSGGELPFPGGESKKNFQERCVNAFQNLMEKRLNELKENSLIAFVIHGGTIMSIMDCYSTPHKDYFQWQISNGTGLLVEIKQGSQNFEIELLEKLERKN